MREVTRGLVMGLAIAAVPAGAAGVYLCVQADMGGLEVAIVIAVVLAEVAFVLWMMRVPTKSLLRAMPQVMLWTAVGGLGLLAVSAFVEAASVKGDQSDDTAEALISGTILCTMAIALAMPPSRRWLGRLFRWPTVLFLAALLWCGPFGGWIGNTASGVGAILALQLIILEFVAPWDRRSTPAWRREYRFPKVHGEERAR